MESDSDHFESADEDFESDNDEPKGDHLAKNQPAHEIHDVQPLDVHVNNHPSGDQTEEDAVKEINKNITDFNIDNQTNTQKNTDIVDNIKHVDLAESKVIDSDTSSQTVTMLDNVTEIKNKSDGQRSKPRPEKIERPQRNRESKNKLGVKLGSKITTDKSQIEKIFKEQEDDEKVGAEPKRAPPERMQCWEDSVGWEQFKTTDKSEPKTDLYSKNKEVDWGDFEADYMEIPHEKREEKSDNIHPVLEKLSDSAKEQSGGWGGWGNWGVSSLLSTASLGVTTLKSSVTQGITTVLESGIGAPDPEELARVHKEQERLQRQEPVTGAEPQPEPQPEQRPDGAMGFGLGNLVSGVSHITRLVETTGTKVLSGGLDTLEVIGKKTMEVLQEGDPGLKKKRALFRLDQDKPILSHVLRDAKQRAEEENRLLEQNHFARKAHYETLFDDYQGLVHLEALEMLSKQCDIKLETLTDTYSGDTLSDLQETMTQIRELCELPDEEDDEQPDAEAVRQRLQAAVADLGVAISYEGLLHTLGEVEVWLGTEVQSDERLVHRKAIETLAQLTAIAVEQFHKAGELLLIKDRRSTVDEADSLVQLTITLTALIGTVARKFSEKMNTLMVASAAKEDVNDLITNIFLEAANSSSYIQDAFQLFIPVLQVGAV